MYVLFESVIVLVCLINIEICTVEGFQSYRLPTEVSPVHYSVKLHPDLEQGTFTGEVSIYVRAKTAVDKITLHSCHLNITEVSVNDLEAKFVYENHEKISLYYENENFQPGEHRVHIKFSGKLYQDFGLLKASYTRSDHTGYLIVNEFEPTSARKAFPCFDEPSFKSKFNVRLIAPNNSYIALSNMPEIRRFNTSNGVVFDFATTVEMSTYLVSFAITDHPFYEEIYEENGRKIPIRAYAYNASKENNEYAISCASQALKYYTEYTNISYPLPKLDMIEYNKTKSPATEIWGLIQFEQGILTTNLGHYDKWQTELIIFHELAHFWFGNLVTNAWWNDLWLQEGFATYMSFKLKAMIHENDITQQMRFISSDLFETERTKKTRPIVDYMRLPESIESRFDDIIYDKGAAVLLMLENIIGEKTFQKVIQTFLKRFAYKTATTNDFIATVESLEPNVNIRSYIESYIYQIKYPLVNVESYNDTYVLTQASSVPDITPGRQKWTIPISYVSNIDKKPKLVWFDKDMASLEISVPGAKWVLFNSFKCAGFYKVNYSDDLWEKLISNHEDLELAEFNNLMENAVILFLNKLRGCDTVFKLISQMKKSSIHTTYRFYLHLAERLICYKNDYDSLVRFMNQRLKAIGSSPIRKQHFTCEEGKRNITLDSHTEACARYIREEL